MAHEFLDEVARCLYVALYISPGIPSVPVALLFSRCIIVFWISCRLYGLVIHVSISGFFCITAPIGEKGSYLLELLRDDVRVCFFVFC